MLVFFKLLNNLSLNRNSGVIRSRQPKRSKTLHPFPTRESVHDRMLKGMTHVQTARDVWRRNDDRKFDGVRVLIDFGRKKAALFPAFVMIFFGRFGVVGLFEFHSNQLSVAGGQLSVQSRATLY